MIKLHRPWRTSDDLKQRGDPVDFFQKRWPDKPSHIALELSKLERRRKQSEHVVIDREDMFEYEQERPEWLDLLGNTEFAAMEHGDFKHNDFTQHGDYNHSKAYGAHAE
eukprot:5651379-Prymnesium_polylepis.1